jgi:hypothetical protein
MVMTVIFEDVVETVMQLPYDQREMLVDLIYHRHIELRRQEIARNAQVSLSEFHAGRLQAQSSQDVIAALHQALDEE